MKRIMFNNILSHPGEEVYSVRYSPDSLLLAAGIGDGTVRIVKVASNTLLQKVEAAKELYTPCTVVKWKPKKDTGICIAGCSNGSFLQFHAVSGKEIHYGKEENNQILTLDYDCEGNKFATAGKDYNVIQIAEFPLTFQKLKNILLA